MTDEPNRVPLRKDAPWPNDLARSELLDLHRTLIEEYRFQVKLNSDRIQMYLDAVETTSGMTNEQRMLEDPAWLERPIGRKTITGRLILIFRFFAVVDALVAVFTVATVVAETYAAW